MHDAHEAFPFHDICRLGGDDRARPPLVRPALTSALTPLAAPTCARSIRHAATFSGTRDCDAILAKVGCICTDVIDIKGTNALVDTTAATRDISLAGICDPGPYGDDVIHNTVIYRWTAPATGVFVLSTCNIVNYDSRLAVMTGCDPTTTIACNDDVIGTCANFSSKLSFSADAGATYYFLVGGYSEADVGTGTLTIEPFQVELTLQGAHQYTTAAGGNDHRYGEVHRWRGSDLGAVEGQG
jgi:hypothetical protein